MLVVACFVPCIAVSCLDGLLPHALNLAVKLRHLRVGLTGLCGQLWHLARSAAVLGQAASYLICCALPQNLALVLLHRRVIITLQTGTGSCHPEVLEPLGLST